MTLSNDKLQGTIYTGAWTVATGNIPLLVNEWNHVAMSYNGSEIKLYVNGKFDNSVSKTGDFNISNGCTVIGRYNSGGCGVTVSGYFNGYIDSLRIYNESL